MDRTTIEQLNIQKVDRDTEMANRLLRFVDDFSWLEVKDHILQMIKSWTFKEWETPFVATIGDRIVGMARIMKSDYYPLPEIYPWVSSIFVSEEYRGRKISGKLIDFANEYAKSIGFIKTYIPA